MENKRRKTNIKEKDKEKENKIEVNEEKTEINEDKENVKFDLKPKSTIKNKIVMCIWICILIGIIYCVTMLMLYTLGKVGKSSVPAYEIVDNLVVKLFPRYYETEEIYNLDIATLGSIYTSSYVEKNYMNVGLDNAFKNIKEMYNDYDLVLANLKADYPFKATENFNDNLFKSLNELGVKGLSLSSVAYTNKNNSYLDVLSKNIEDNNINTIGINKEGNNTHIYEQNNIKVGVLSYLVDIDEDAMEKLEYLNNGENDKNTTKKEDILVKENDKNSYLNYYSKEKLTRDMEYFKKNNVDLVIGYLDFADQKTSMINLSQKKYAEELSNAGVNLVLETGRANVQSVFEGIYEADNGSQTHGYTMYSLGDFFGSYNSKEKSNISTSANISVTKKVIKDNFGNIVENKTVTSMTVNNPNLLYTDDSMQIYDVEDTLEEDDLEGKLQTNLSNVYKEYKSVLNLK